MARLLTTKDVMERLALKKEDAVYALVRTGQLAAMKIVTRAGGRPRYRFEEAELQRYLDSIRTAPASAPYTPSYKARAQDYFDLSRRLKPLPRPGK